MNSMTIHSNSQNTMNSTRLFVQQFYHFFFRNQKIEVLVYGITLLTAFAYAVISHFVLGRSPRSTMYEGAALGVILLLGLVFTYVFRIVRASNAVQNSEGVRNLKIAKEQASPSSYTLDTDLLISYLAKIDKAIDRIINTEESQHQTAELALKAMSSINELNQNIASTVGSFAETIVSNHSRQMQAETDRIAKTLRETIARVLSDFEGQNRDVISVLSNTLETRNKEIEVALGEILERQSSQFLTALEAITERMKVVRESNPSLERIRKRRERLIHESIAERIQRESGVIILDYGTQRFGEKRLTFDPAGPSPRLVGEGIGATMDEKVSE